MGQPTPEFLNRSWTADVGRHRRCFHNSWASRRWLVSEEDLRTWLKGRWSEEQLDHRSGVEGLNIITECIDALIYETIHIVLMHWA
jgi:hypothetical protein